jgi:hypothetical protein
MCYYILPQNFKRKFRPNGQQQKTHTPKESFKLPLLTPSTHYIRCNKRERTTTPELKVLLPAFYNV